MERKYLLCFEAAIERDKLQATKTPKLKMHLAADVENFLILNKGCGSDEASEITKIVVGCDSDGDPL